MSVPRKKKVLIAFGIVVLLLVGVRLALPTIVQRYVNKVLDENPDYDGSVGDVDIYLYRGAYSIDAINIVKTDSKVPVPFFKTEKLDLSLGWKELFEGAISARLKFTRPEVNFVDGKGKKEQQSGKEGAWGDTLDKLVPFKISRLEVEDGAVHFRNYDASPPVDIWLRDLNANLRNLTNSKDAGQDLFATCNLSAVALGGGKLNVDLKLDPRSEKPTFDLKSKLLGMDLRALNAFFKKYAKLDFTTGQGDIVVEVTAKQGKLEGYVKPLLKNIDVLSLKDDAKDGIFAVIWEGIAGTIAQLFKNQGKDQLATKIPIQGSLDNPETGTFMAITGVLRNAFVQAFTPFYDKSFKTTAE